MSNAHGAGLGTLVVLSSLGQPLRAEIELTSVSKDEAGALVPKLASPEVFRQANIEYNPALASLRFAVEQRGSRQFIKITSSQPLNEPFVDMLLELAGPNGRLVREYTFLLDPPDLRTAQSVLIAPAKVPEGATAKAQQPSVGRPAAAERPARQTAAARPATKEASNEAQPTDYRVRSGDTLARIAGQVKSGSVSLDQMLVALYRANPDAFIDRNMNRLRAGQILSVPSTETAGSIAKAEAKAEVLAHSADFNNYRNKLAGQVAASAARKSAESGQAAAGSITAKVEEPTTPASEAKDKLKLSSAKSPAGGAAGTAAAEEKIARDKAIAEADARVKELEKNIGELQKLLEVKNQSLAGQQNMADASNAGGKAPESAPAAKAAAPAAAAPDATPAAAASAEAHSEVKPENKPAAAAPAPAPAPAKPKPVAPEPAPEPSFIDSLLDNPLVLPGLGALLVALGGLGVMSARRKKQQKQFDDSIITDSSLKANSLFGSTGGQSVDTNNSVFNSNFSPSASQLDTNEVDPVAEADVYIAYGRDAQAEEILKEALRTQPDRHAVRVKLLEIYSNRKDMRAFEALATELYGLTKGEGDEWLQAAALGIAIDPQNPLYAAAKPVKAAGAEEPVLAIATQPVPTQPLDEDLEALLSTTGVDDAAQAVDSLEDDSAYFSAASTTLDKPLDPPAIEPLPELAAEPDSASADSNVMEFDVGGLSLPDMEVPNTIPRPESSEPNIDLASIDFDFLKEPATVAMEAAAAAAGAEEIEIPLVEDAAPIEEAAVLDMGIELSSEDADPLDFELPAMTEDPAAESAKPDAADVSESLDFDLSGISLELPPSAPEAEADFTLDTLDIEAPAADGAGLSSIDAEMATKLDLAIAYQEIGDKEGARELLDEVVKGGTAEQSERAKSLLMELA